MNVSKGSKIIIHVTVNNPSIPQTNSTKFLGREISSSLTVDGHYNKVIVKSENKLFKLISTIKAGLRLKAAINFYKSFVRSKIGYCRTFTTNCIKIVHKKIQTFQKSLLGRALGVTPSTPIPLILIYVLANEHTR